MLLRWLDARDAHRFGEELARFFIEKMPLDTPRTDKKFAVKTQNLLRNIDQRVREFKTVHPLNIYTRAKLGNQFRWTLTDAGYDASYVKELTDWLVKRL